MVLLLILGDKIDFFLYVIEYYFTEVCLKGTKYLLIKLYVISCTLFNFFPPPYNNDNPPTPQNQYSPSLTYKYMSHLNVYLYSVEFMVIQFFCQFYVLLFFVFCSKLSQSLEIRHHWYIKCIEFVFIIISSSRLRK